jgi:hypothetical protein
MAAGVRATATQRVQAFHKAHKEGAVASQVTPRGNSERTSGKQDLSQNITLAGLMGQIASGDQERTSELERLPLNDSTAPDVDGTLDKRYLKLRSPQSGLGQALREQWGPYMGPVALRIGIL